MLLTLSHGRIPSSEESMPPGNGKAEGSVGGFSDFPNRCARKSGSAGRFSEFPSLRAGNLLQQLGKPAAGSPKPVHGGAVTRKTRREGPETLHGGPQTRKTRQLGGWRLRKLGKPASPRGGGYSNSGNLPGRRGTATETRKPARPRGGGYANSGNLPTQR